MKEIILQKSNFRCRENIYICRPLRRLRRLAVEYVKNILLTGVSASEWDGRGTGRKPMQGVRVAVERDRGGESTKIINAWPPGRCKRIFSTYMWTTDHVWRSSCVQLTPCDADCS